MHIYRNFYFESCKCKCKCIFIGIFYLELFFQPALVTKQSVYKSNNNQFKTINYIISMCKYMFVETFHLKLFFYC